MQFILRGKVSRVRPLYSIVMRVILTAIAALLLAAISTVWAQAPFADSRHPNPVKINRCAPEHNPGSPGGYVGYAPAYYPAGRYYWVDPYRRSYYQPPASPSGTLYIDYVNAAPNEMATIDFGLVARGHLVAEVRDVGKFSPGVEIKHRFGISPNVFPLGTALPACVPLRVEYTNGTHWLNPRLPTSDRDTYESTSSAPAR